MGNKKRDEFPKPVQRLVAERAAYICSNPSCRVGTIVPHSDPNKSLKTGIAAHIRAASAGGPRYDVSQSADDRTNILNGIWLCTACSMTVDKDEARFPPTLLIQWRNEHEEWLQTGGIVPRLPELSITTLNGFTLPDQPGTMKLQELKDLREHRLKVWNGSSTVITTIEARFQFPEPVVAVRGRDRPTGVEVEVRPDHPEMIVGGSGTVTRNRPPLPSKAYKLGIDRLPPTRSVEIAVYTSLNAHDGFDLDLNSPLWSDLADGNFLLNYAQGSFQFEYRGAMLVKKMFAPIGYDKDTRVIRVIEMRSDQGKWKPIDMSIMA